jgi:hypothetical protein
LDECAADDPIRTFAAPDLSQRTLIVAPFRWPQFPVLMVARKTPKGAEPWKNNATA